MLGATTPGDAIARAEGHPDKIHLLVTDVVMPEMNGRELAGRLHTFYPDLNVLFMSGYTSEAITHQGVLDHGMQFIQKPFSKEELAVKVRAMLDGDA